MLRIDPEPPRPLDAAEYALIETALAETERGRRFLADHAARHGGADTRTLLSAIARLEKAVAAERPVDPDGAEIGSLRGGLMDMAEAIARTRSEITAMSAHEAEPSRLSLASEALDAIVRATERATTDILGAAEAMQEVAWTLRETGTDAHSCDALDRRATEIYTACSFQDLTAQRTARVIHTLRYLEERIASMIAIWGGRIEPAPDARPLRPAAGPELCQNDVDHFLGTHQALETPPPPFPPIVMPDDEIVFVPDGALSPEPAAEPAAETAAKPGPVAPPADTDLCDAFADLDRLSIEEKIALFS